MSILLALLGVAFIALAVINPSWLLEGKKAYPFVKLFGQSGARIFYGLLGFGIVFLSLYWF